MQTSGRYKNFIVPEQKCSIIINWMLQSLMDGMLRPAIAHACQQSTCDSHTSQWPPGEQHLTRQKVGRAVWTSRYPDPDLDVWRPIPHLCPLWHTWHLTTCWAFYRLYSAGGMATQTSSPHQYIYSHITAFFSVTLFVQSSWVFLCFFFSVCIGVRRL